MCIEGPFLRFEQRGTMVVARVRIAASHLLFISRRCSADVKVIRGAPRLAGFETHSCHLVELNRKF